MVKCKLLFWELLKCLTIPIKILVSYGNFHAFLQPKNQFYPSCLPWYCKDIIFWDLTKIYKLLNLGTLSMPSYAQQEWKQLDVYLHVKNKLHHSPFSLWNSGAKYVGNNVPRQFQDFSICLGSTLTKKLPKTHCILHQQWLRHSLAYCQGLWFGFLTVETTCFT